MIILMKHVSEFKRISKQHVTCYRLQLHVTVQEMYWVWLRWRPSIGNIGGNLLLFKSINMQMVNAQTRKSKQSEI